MDLQVVERVARILEVVGESEGIGVTDVATRTGLPLPTASRLLANLRERGRLQRVGRLYHLTAEGARFAEGLGVDARARAAEAVRAPLAAAQHDLGETVAVWRLDHRRRTASCISAAWPRSPLRVAFDAGWSLPLHAGAAGVVLLARGGDLLREDVLRAPLPAVAKRTVVEPDRLLDLLHAVKRRGWASSVHADVDGVWSLAVGGGAGGAVVAASLHGPTARERRVGEPEVERLRRLLAEVAPAVGP